MEGYDMFRYIVENTRLIVQKRSFRKSRPDDWLTNFQGTYGASSQNERRKDFTKDFVKKTDQTYSLLCIPQR